MLSGLGAVRVDEKLIASERVGSRSFHVWGRLMLALGPQGSRARTCGLLLYVAFLVTLILTLVPVTALLKKLLSPLLRGRTQRQKAYFAAPSGE